jgi:hypothetical protein
MPPLPFAGMFYGSLRDIGLSQSMPVSLAVILALLVATFSEPLDLGTDVLALLVEASGCVGG